MRPDDRLAEAIFLRESGDLEQALPLLLALREEFPDDARIAVQTAWTHDSLGHPLVIPAAVGRARVVVVDVVDGVKTYEAQA